MSNEIFLVDANALITPHLTYYPFDFAPSFWQQLDENIKSGKIVFLDLVKDELLKGEDSLKIWVESLNDITVIDHRQPDILQNYSQILQYIQKSPFYKPEALTEWSKSTVADPWLIATAKKYDYTLITFEKEVFTNVASPSKNAKIPNVAKAFKVKTSDLFYMMRQLGFAL